MFARVLFPTDFSVYENTVFDCLPELKSARMREVILLSVIRPSDVPMPETVNRESLEYWRWSLEEQLNITRMALEGRDLRVTARVEYRVGVYFSRGRPDLAAFPSKNYDSDSQSVMSSSCISPLTKNTTRSQIFVTRSARRSRLCAAQIT